MVIAFRYFPGLRPGLVHLEDRETGSELWPTLTRKFVHDIGREPELELAKGAYPLVTAIHVSAGDNGGELIRTPSGVLLPADIDSFHRRLHRIAPSGLIDQTTQTTGMKRLEAISGKTVGAKNLWMGQTQVPASMASANHHHGASETAIYVVSGTPLFVFLDLEGEEPIETHIQTAPGDYVFVPPYVPHREENPDPDIEAVVVIARTTQEAIVVNLDGLDWAEVRTDEPTDT